MEEPYLTLFTIAINTLITYFLLNRQEKRLAEKAFQQQVKFQRSHEKRMEVLENLYQKVLAFQRAFSDELGKIIYADYSAEGIKPLEWTAANIARLKGFLAGEEERQECLTYLKDNRIYLPNSMATEIDSTIRKTFFAYKIIMFVHYFSHFDLETTIHFLNVQIEESGNVISKIDPYDPNLSHLLEQLRLYVSACTDTVEALYRSAADIN